MVKNNEFGSNKTSWDFWTFANKATLILFVGLQIFTSKSPWPESTNRHRRPLLWSEDGIVSRAQFLFEWSRCTAVYYRFDGRRVQDYTFPVAKQQNILIDHMELQTCKHGRYDRQKIFIGDTNQRRNKK
jgi:hypothetical protein